MTTTTKLQFVKSEDYDGAPTYAARVEHPMYHGRYIIDPVYSQVYESRITGYTVRWVADSEQWRGRQIGSLKTINGKGERYLRDAKAAAQADFNDWNN